MAPCKRSCWEIYNKEMSQLNRGDALWEPAPELERIQPGDVGYILKGCFHLLFSAGHPLGEREIGVDVPHTFKQLLVGPTFTTQPRSPGYLSTDTVEEISVHARAPMYPMLESGSSISFQLTGGEGAALLTKHPTYREDAKLGRTFEEYTKTHYNSWVAFARDRGHPNDIKPVLVTGVDVTRDFAMVSYSNDGSDLRAQFTTSAPGVAFPWGTWRAPGVVHTNCGPQPSRPPSGNGHTEIVSDGYNQCVFVRYYTMRKRLGIPRVIKAAAGPHDLGPGGRDDTESLFDLEYSSDSDSDISSSLFDDDGDDDDGSVTSIDSESDIAIHNTTPDERDDFDTIADYIFQNSDADSVLIHHRDVARLRELGGDADLSTKLVGKRPLITVDRDGVGTIEHQTEPPVNTQTNGCEATDRMVTLAPRPPSHQGNSRLQSVASRSQEAATDVGCYANIPGPTVGWRSDVLKLSDIGIGSTQEREVSNDGSTLAGPADTTNPVVNWLESLDSEADPPDDQKPSTESHIHRAYLETSTARTKVFFSLFIPFFQFLHLFLLATLSKLHTGGSKAPREDVPIAQSKDAPTSLSPSALTQFFYPIQHECPVCRGSVLRSKQLSVGAPQYDALRSAGPLLWNIRDPGTIDSQLHFLLALNGTREAASVTCPRWPLMFCVSTRLSHPNVNPFLDLTQHPNVSTLKLLTEISHVLQHVHNHNIHGNVKMRNILVDGGGVAHRGGLGSAFALSIPANWSDVDTEGLFRGIAPGLINPHTSGLVHAQPTKVAAFAFSVLAWEILSGRPPFTGESEEAEFLSGFDIDRPLRSVHHEVSDRVWAMMQRCWDEDNITNVHGSPWHSAQKIRTGRRGGGQRMTTLYS